MFAKVSLINLKNLCRFFTNSSWKKSWTSIFSHFNDIFHPQIAIFCLIGAVSAAPKPEAEADPQFYAGHPFGYPYAAPVAYAPVVPVCTTVEEEIEVQTCAPRVENVCTTTDVTSQEITYEKQCKEVVEKNCAPGAVAAPALVLKKREAEAEADPQFLAHPGVYGLAPHVALASPTTAVVKSACHEVVTEHCTNVPIPVEKVTPVETCHAVTKVDCTPLVKKIPKVVCETPEVAEAAAPAELDA